METLNRDDFAVVDDGSIVRDFRSLQHSDETVLDIVLLVDTSESMRPDFAKVRGAVSGLLAEEEIRGDKISVIGFGGMQPRTLCEKDCRAAEVGKTLDGLRIEGATPLFDALAYSAKRLSAHHEPGMRQIILLLSDGNDTVSASSFAEATDQLNAAGAVVYSLQVAHAKTSSQENGVSQQVAEATGGRLIHLPEHSNDLSKTVLEDLHASYVVTYQLPHPVEGFHSLRILPKHNLSLRFFCRRGYNYEEIR